MQTYQELQTQAERLASQNDRLSGSLRAARTQIVQLREDLSRMAEPPNTYATFLAPAEPGTVTVLAGGRRMRVGLAAGIDAGDLHRGQDLLLNENMVVIMAKPSGRTGQVVQVVDTSADGRVIVRLAADEERLLERGSALEGQPLRSGDLVLADLKSALVLERIERSEIADLVLESVPDVTYDDIGGLGPQIDAIRDAVELPFTHQDLFREHGLRPPKGVLLYGPPGCGKTMIAKAVANGLASARTGGARRGVESRSYFLNIKGPELLSKYVGETERSIRLVFERAREKASTGRPVVIFFDEMESLFRTRGTGVSSDVENTIVPQLLTELDGVESLDNVIVIGASNREDMIDPAILRAGRLDVKIRIERPDRPAAREIFDLYLDDSVPISASATRADLVDAALDLLYDADSATGFLELIFDSGAREALHYRDFVSGAAIHNIVDRAKKAAIKDLLRSGSKGITVAHMRESVSEEFTQSEDLAGIARPDEWARISGRRGDRVRGIRVIPQEERA